MMWNLRENNQDGRSRTSFQIDEQELEVLMRLMKEMMEAEG